MSFSRADVTSGDLIGFHCPAEPIQGCIVAGEGVFVNRGGLSAWEGDAPAESAVWHRFSIGGLSRLPVADSPVENRYHSFWDTHACTTA